MGVLFFKLQDLSSWLVSFCAGNGNILQKFPFFLLKGIAPKNDDTMTIQKCMEDFSALYTFHGMCNIKIFHRFAFFLEKEDNASRCILYPIICRIDFKRTFCAPTELSLPRSWDVRRRGLANVFLAHHAAVSQKKRKGVVSW